MPGRSRIDEKFQRTVIAAAQPPFPFPWDVIRDTYDFCHAQCEASYMWKQPLFIYGSRPLACQFATKTLRYISLCARGEFETANAERAGDQLGSVDRARRPDVAVLNSPCGASDAGRIG